MEIERDILTNAAEKFGTPCFVYSLDQIERRIAKLNDAFDRRFTISYAMKCNPNPRLLDWLQHRVGGLDVSSGGEIDRAIQANWPPEQISFTGPAKRSFELKSAVQYEIGEVVLESIEEAIELNELAKDAQTTQSVMIRVAPEAVPAGMGVAMAGKACQFGIDEEVVDEAIPQIKQLKNLKLCGFHIYSGTQCLRADSLIENYAIFTKLFRRLCNRHNIVPQKLVYGAGLGIPYYKASDAVDLDSVAREVNSMLDNLKGEEKFTNTEFVLETGRYLVGEAGYYLTRVIRVKRSRGAEIAICDGGMNHHLGACGHLGSIIHRNYQMFKVSPSEISGDVRKFDIVGPLCTSIDTLGRDVPFDSLACGDLIAIGCSGAYGPTASPRDFISHAAALEILVSTRESGPEFLITGN
jgi:diaminopimelate decarboxylase